MEPVSISGYHIREAGSTAVQELAFTLADGFHYVETASRAAWTSTTFAPRLTFFFNAHNDVFEEIAKYRAARGSGPRAARALRRREESAWKLRFHAQTAGCLAAAQQPEVNLIARRRPGAGRGAGRRQSLHTNSMDETLALPTEHAVTLALRTQQVLASRDRRDQHGRSARRQLLRRDADEQLRREARDVLRRASTSSAA